jgi:hypothetical protein
MHCVYCGGRCYTYDGGEQYEYSLCVYVCGTCGEWQDEDTDELEEQEA